MGGRSSFLYKGNAGFFSSYPARLITFLDYSILEYLRRIIAFLIRGAPGWLVGASLGGKDSEVNTSNVNIVNYPACALRALGLLLADGALTVGRGKTF